MPNTGQFITRLAPSPTGALHLGNARTFLLTWLWARRHSARVIFRLEDLDGPRTKPGAAQQAIDDLRWLGLDWDAESPPQSTRSPAYAAAVAHLLTSRSAYRCNCSRKEAEQAASAPHASDGAVIYPGTCRRSPPPAATAAAVRFAVPPATDGGAVSWHDMFAGPRHIDVPQQLGDFIIQKSDGTAAYQIAVVIDDSESAVTHIIRGDDLLDSAARQILLYRSLGLQHRLPQYMHLPLVVGDDGRRLAKRHGDTRISAYRAAGVSAGRVRGLLAAWCRWQCSIEPSTDELLAAFDLSRLPQQAVIMGAPEDEFLRRPLVASLSAPVSARLCTSRVIL